MFASYDVEIAKKYGINAAILLQKISYLQQYSNREDGYCWRTAAELEEETGLTKKQQMKATEILLKSDLIKLKVTYKEGTSERVKHYKIIESDQRELSESDQRELSESDQRELSESDQRELSKINVESDQRELSESDQRELSESDQRELSTLIEENNNNKENNNNNNNTFFCFFKNFYKQKTGTNYTAIGREDEMANLLGNLLLDDYNDVPAVVFPAFLENIPDWYIHNAFNIKSLYKNYNTIKGGAAENIIKSLEIKKIDYKIIQLKRLDACLSTIKLNRYHNNTITLECTEDQYNYLENNYIKLKKIIKNKKLEYLINK